MSATPYTTIVTVVVMLVLPVSIWFEYTYPERWNMPVVPIDVTAELLSPRQTHAPTTVLPTTITESTTLTTTDSPVLLTTITTVAPNATLTINPGVLLIVNYQAQLVIAGKLLIAGTDTAPVRATSNEDTPDKQTWGGIVVTATGQATITHLVSRYATPAISCMAGSQVAVHSSTLTETLVGVYTESDHCEITDSRIQALIDGVVSVGVTPLLDTTTIAAGETPHRHINQ